jgi:zinc/manganese transport system permease protein
MTDAIALLWPPFLVALCLIGIHAYFGIQVLARRVIFVDLALAQIAALGATVAFMLGHPAQGAGAYAYSLLFTLLAALLLAFTRAWSTRIPQEALIGVIYVVAAAAAILLIDRAPQGAEHLKQILTGNILTSGLGELTTIVPLYLAVGIAHFALQRHLSPDHHTGWVWEFIFYASFGIVVTSSVALAGVLLVFSFLIVPAAIGVLYCDTLARQLAVGWISGTFASVAGLSGSYWLDLPTGAAMVCAFGLSLALAGLVRPFVVHGARVRARRQMLLASRWCIVLLLAGSATALMVAPRADQPLLDTLEYLFPGLRGLYMRAGEVEIYRDADLHAERYRGEAERLNETEIRSRSTGQMDDLKVRHISSFLKSYGEMRKGEEFVKHEVRSRARERVRFVVGSALFVVALAFAPGLTNLLRGALSRRRHTASLAAAREM